MTALKAAVEVVVVLLGGAWLALSIAVLAAEEHGQGWRR